MPSMDALTMRQAGVPSGPAVARDANRADRRQEASGPAPLIRDRRLQITTVGVHYLYCCTRCGYARFYRCSWGQTAKSTPIIRHWGWTGHTLAVGLWPNQRQPWRHIFRAQPRCSNQQQYSLNFYHDLCSQALLRPSVLVLMDPCWDLAQTDIFLGLKLGPFFSVS